MPLPPEIDPKPEIKVYTRAAWADDWEERPTWQAVSCSDAAEPTLPTAKLRIRFGEIKREDATTFTEEEDPGTSFSGVDGLFVKIETTVGEEAPEPLFYGFIPTRETIWHDKARDRQSGDVDMTAYGLAYLLDNQVVRGSWCDGADDIHSGLIQWVSADIIFNHTEHWGLPTRGNRSAVSYVYPTYAAVDGRPEYKNWTDGAEYQAFLFLENPIPNGSAHAKWRASDIVRYLLLFFGTHGGTDKSAALFIRPGASVDVLDAWTPASLNLSGMTIRQALNRVIDRRRGFGWCIRVDPIDESVSLHVFTATPTTITAGAATVPANAEPFPLTLDNDWRASDPRFVDDHTTRYDRIEVRGELVKVMATLYYDGDGYTGFRRGWTGDEETAYDATDDRGRSTLQFQHVYQRFVVHENYDWSQHSRKLNDDGTFHATHKADIRRWGRRLERELPLRGQDEKFKAAFAFFADPYNVGKFIFSHSLGAALPEGTPTVNIGEVTMLDDRAGIYVSCSPNHLIAAGTFSGSSAHWPVLDYATLGATVCFETDTHLQVVETIEGGDPGRVLTIDVPNAEAWFISPNTVLDINLDGTLAIQATWLELRNDRDILQAVAAFARAWYGLERRTLSFGWKGLVTSPAVGQMITTCDAGGVTHNVNTPVTAIAWDLDNLTTTFQTDWDQLDPTAATFRIA